MPTKQQHARNVRNTEETSTSVATAATAENLATAGTARMSTAVRTTESAGPTAQETTEHQSGDVDKSSTQVVVETPVLTTVGTPTKAGTPLTADTTTTGGTQKMLMAAITSPTLES
jgi:hypothetical protein